VDDELNVWNKPDSRCVSWCFPCLNLLIESCMARIADFSLPAAYSSAACQMPPASRRVPSGGRLASYAPSSLHFWERWHSGRFPLGIGGGGCKAGRCSCVLSTSVRAGGAQQGSRLDWSRRELRLPVANAVLLPLVVDSLAVPDASLVVLTERCARTRSVWL